LKVIFDLVDKSTNGYFGTEFTHFEFFAFKFFKIIIFCDKINYKTKEIHEIALRIKIT